MVVSTLVTEAWFKTSTLVMCLSHEIFRICLSLRCWKRSWLWMSLVSVVSYGGVVSYLLRRPRCHHMNLSANNLELLSSGSVMTKFFIFQEGNMNWT